MIDHLVPLPAAANATGQPVRRLRNWCATGKLECELADAEWHISLSQLLRIPGLAAERDQAIAAGRPVAAVVPVTTASPELPGEIARRLSLTENAVSTSTLALDGKEWVVAVWRAGDGAPNLAPVIDLVEELGGELLDGEVSVNE